MSNVNIRSSEVAWGKGEVIIFGRRVKGLRGWEFKKTVEKEHLYGAGSNAIDIQEGNVKCDGNIKVLGFELDALNKTAQMAGFTDITEVPHEAILITINLKKSPADKTTKVTITGVAFTESGSAMEQGAKMREVTLPYLAMDITMVTL